MPPKASLRDTVAASLATLPNATRLGLTVASSTPKRTTTLFPHASPSSSVRCWETEHLVVVDCGLPEEDDSGQTPPQTQTQPQASSSSTAPGSGTSENGVAPPPHTAGRQSVLAAAISVNVYTLPTKDKPTTLVYISKVDSSGYALGAGPLTRELAIGVLEHFLSPATRPTERVVATLFARSQGQYLFPNSVAGGGKRVLGGLGLCQWWKGVYEGAASRLVQLGTPTGELQLRYLLPSYSAAEAKGMLRVPISPPPVEWSYGPPFVAPLLPAAGSLAVLIPSLPDDPKTRFLDELASAALEATPYAHTEAAASANATASAATEDPTSTSGPAQAPASPKKRRREAIAEEEDRKRTHAALAKVAPDEFWERIGFRQECSSGDVTGFFAIAVDGARADGSASASAVPKPQPNETADGPNSSTATATNTTAGTPPPTLSLPLVERLLKSLLNTDFGSRPLAAAGTRMWLDSARRLVVDEVGERGWEACVASIQAKAGEGERVERKRKEEVVTVLQVRKRKK